jgi:hypothetical protein
VRRTNAVLYRPVNSSIACRTSLRNVGVNIIVRRINAATYGVQFTLARNRIICQIQIDADTPEKDREMFAKQQARKDLQLLFDALDKDLA